MDTRVVRSPLIETAAHVLVPAQLVVGVWLFLRGHDHPGGGFIAGLVVSGGVILYASSVGKLPFQFHRLPRALAVLVIGWTLAFSSGLLAVLFSRPFMTAVWIGVLPFPPLGEIKIGTVLLFDLGVFLIVVGLSLVALQLPRRDAS